MIRAGSWNLLKVCCLECGTPVQIEGKASDFFVMCCKNKDCMYAGANVVVERRTGIVLMCDAQVWYTKDGPERVFPAMFDKDGKQIWPEKKYSVDEVKEKKMEDFEKGYKQALSDYAIKECPQCGATFFGQMEGYLTHHCDAKSAK